MARFKTFTVSEVATIRRILDEHAERVGWDSVPMEVLSMGAFLGEAARVAGQSGDPRVVVEASAAATLAPLWTEGEVTA